MAGRAFRVTVGTTSDVPMSGLAADGVPATDSAVALIAGVRSAIDSVGLADTVVADLQSGLRVGLGAADLSTLAYAIPGLASDRYVSPSGSNAAAGSVGAPWATFEYAMANTPANGTIVLRGGVYREGKYATTLTDNNTKGYTAIIRNASAVTIQSYPGEEVWFDGSNVFASNLFTADSGWWSMPWDPTGSNRGPFRRDPGDTWYGGTYPPAANNWPIMDNPAQYWTQVDATNFPCAAWPEHAWIDNVELAHVDLLSKMAAGKMFFDAYNRKVFIDRDPTGHTVEITTKQTLMNLMWPGCSLLGVGIRRYATSKPQGAPVKVHSSGCFMENVIFEDISAQAVNLIGVSSNVGANNFHGKRLTFRRIGCMGLGGHMIDNPWLEDCRFEQWNNRRFFYAPTAAGVKYTATRNPKTERCAFFDGWGKGLWCDVDCRDIITANCDFRGNWQRDVVYEMTSEVWHVGNKHWDSGWEALVFQDSERAHVWNNSVNNSGWRRGLDTLPTSSANVRAVALFTSGRSPRETWAARVAAGGTGGAGSSSYFDDRIAAGTVPAWPTSSGGYQLKLVDVQNNIVGPGNFQAYFGTDIQDWNYPGNSVKYTDFPFTLNHNWWNRLPASWTTQYPFLFANPTTTAMGYVIKTNIAGIRTLGFDTAGVETSGTQTMDTATGTLLASYRTAADAAAVAIPSDIAALLGVPTGTVRMGPFERV